MHLLKKNISLLNTVSGQKLEHQLLPLEKVDPLIFFSGKDPAHPHAFQFHYQKLMETKRLFKSATPLEILAEKSAQYFFLTAPEIRTKENIYGYIQVQLRSDSDHKKQFYIPDLIATSYFFPNNAALQIKGVGTTLIAYVSKLYSQLPAPLWSSRPLLVNSCYSGIGFFEKLGMYPLDTADSQQQYYFTTQKLVDFLVVNRY